MTLETLQQAKDLEKQIDKAKKRLDEAIAFKKASKGAYTSFVKMEYYNGGYGRETRELSFSMEQRTLSHWVNAEINIRRFNLQVLENKLSQL